MTFTSFIIDLSKIVCEWVIASSDRVEIQVKQRLRPDYRVAHFLLRRQALSARWLSGLTR